MTISFSGKRKGMDGSTHLIVRPFVCIGSFHMFSISLSFKRIGPVCQICMRIYFISPFKCYFHSMDRDVYNSYEAILSVLELLFKSIFFRALRLCMFNVAIEFWRIWKWRSSYQQGSIFKHFQNFGKLISRSGVTLFNMH